jgi:membrane protease YdiL (CAAX protease family)
MSTPPFTYNSENPKAQRPRSLGERAFLVPDGRLRAYVRVILFVFCALAIQVAVATVFDAFAHDASLWSQFFWSSVVLAATYFGLSWIFVRFIDHRDFSTLGLTLQPGWARELCGGLAIGTALQFIVMAILAGTHSVHYSPIAGYSLHLWRLVGANVLLFAIAAIVEELAFRGYAFKWLMSSVGTPAALIILGILFGAAHFRDRKFWPPLADGRKLRPRRRRGGYHCERHRHRLATFDQAIKAFPFRSERFTIARRQGSDYAYRAHHDCPSHAAQLG